MAAKIEQAYYAGPPMPLALQRRDESLPCNRHLGTDFMSPPERGQQAWLAQAKRVCAPCPRVSQCLKWALDKELAGEPLEGVWGGTSARQRRALAAEVRQRLAAAAARRAEFARWELERIERIRAWREAHELVMA